jgi:hypothetical protein
MLEVELRLLSNGSIRVERRLDAVPQHARVHGRGGYRGSVVRPSRRALEAGAV